MSGSFVKLFNTITDSSIWALPDHVRIVWITMLAMADKNGDVSASVVGVAGRARKSLDETLDALRILMAPDPYSRTKMAEGRRLEEIDGGWHFITWEVHRQAIAEEANRAKKRTWWREKGWPASDSAPPNVRLDPESDKESSRDSGSISLSGSDLDLERGMQGGEPDEAVTVVNPRRGRFAPKDFEPTDTHRVRCQELKLPIDDLLRDFKLHEFNRCYTDWDRRFSKWIEDQRIKAETERGKADSGAAKGPRSGFRSFHVSTSAWEPTARHKAFAERHGLDVNLYARSYIRSGMPDKRSLADANDDFAKRLALVARGKPFGLEVAA